MATFAGEASSSFGNKGKLISSSFEYERTTNEGGQNLSPSPVASSSPSSPPPRNQPSTTRIETGAVSEGTTQARAVVQKRKAPALVAPRQKRVTFLPLQLHQDQCSSHYGWIDPQPMFYDILRYARHIYWGPSKNISIFMEELQQTGLMCGRQSRANSKLPVWVFGVKGNILDGQTKFGFSFSSLFFWVFL
ncbi:hypothetical protein ACH5RR_023870 [Cinchona calisaya]|uniref:Uncharacterized protein n=1 Tax=Cinchona calisaya TaxID=153742 RepID=A0ABD2ZD11_9GENT